VSYAACRTAPTTCLTGKWRCVRPNINQRSTFGANFPLLQSVMASSLGQSWRSSFVKFDPIPFAAASIGQVHCAMLAAHISPTGRPERVAVKIQFPNIAESVASDLNYIRILLTAGRLLPRGLFLDKTLTVLYAPRFIIGQSGRS
jgi:predicted unusual protein kinase regulating ubiquinone biosynthesis (AarF/ABC1/UbiB family)